MSKHRVIVDTSCLIGSYLGSRSAARTAIQHLHLSYQFLASRETLAEFREVILRDKFERIPLQLRHNFVAEYERFVMLMEPKLPVSICVDPKDDKFLSLALSGNASLILSDDNHLLQLHPFRGIDILSPKTYLDRIDPPSPR